MNNNHENKGIVVLILIIVAAFLLSWKNINWGKIRFQEETVVVTGESKTKQKNEVASFTAGVTAIKENKDEAIADVNKKMNDLNASIKSFGIKDEDIQTQSINVYEQQEVDRTKKNQWVVNNTLEITLRDVSKTQELVDLLNKSGANNVYGPNFRIEETSGAEKTLFDDAIKDAKEKAEIIAKSSGRKLGKIINVVEGSDGNVYPIYKTMSEGLGGGVAAEPGTSTISKTLTVSFELK